jgi:two-component system cell cycle response regulator DivK
MATIVVADDDVACLEFLVEALNDYGYLAVAASDGGLAARLVHETRPRLVLLDIEMPVLDGYSVLAKIRADENTASVPVFAVTARAMLDERIRALTSGFDAYITKPVDLGRMMALIALGVAMGRQGLAERSTADHIRGKGTA